jgi:GDPmannose 4,6-dehydratase
MHDMQKKALICGISGQDGAYLAKLLLEKGYDVHGTSRGQDKTNWGNLRQLGVSERITSHYMAIEDLSTVQRVLEEVQPDEIYNLGAMSNVKVSFDSPEYVANVDGIGTLRLLEDVRILGLIE